MDTSIANYIIVNYDKDKKVISKNNIDIENNFGMR